MCVTKMADSKPALKLFSIPWDDILFRYVLPFIRLKDLFQLRTTCKDAYECITQYFARMWHLDLIYTGPKFNRNVLARITQDSQQLRTLNLSQAKQWLKPEDVCPIIRFNVNLIRIDLSGCTALNDACIMAMAVFCPSLREVALSGCPWLSDGALLSLAGACPQLQVLDVSGCWQLTDQNITLVIQACRKLVNLSLCSVYSVTDISISALSVNCPDLRVLKIKACWRVTDDGIRHLTEYSKKLRMLHVKDCRSVTEGTLARLRSHGVLVDIPQKAYQVEPRHVSLLQQLKLQI